MTIMMMRNIGMVGYVVALVNIVALVVCLSSIAPQQQQEAQFPAATTKQAPPASAFTTVDAFTSSWTTTTTSRGRVGRNTVTSSNAMITHTFLHAVSGPEPAAEEDAARTMVSRRAALQQGVVAATQGVVAATAIVAMTSVAVPSPAFADIYDEQEKERKLKAQQKAEDGKKLLPKVLFGGTALSVPFFLPNLIRLGKKLFS